MSEKSTEVTSLPEDVTTYTASPLPWANATADQILSDVRALIDSGWTITAANAALHALDEAAAKLGCTREDLIVTIAPDRNPDVLRWDVRRKP